MLNNDYLLKDLNEKQKEFVLLDKGPCVVLAGAGSGKTKALTSKIYYLIKYKNIKPYEILAITFTNKAAKEMKDRVLKYLDDNESYNLNIFTFHSFCARFLRRELDSNFIIFDDKDSKTVIKNILKKEELDEKEFPPNAIMEYISELKNHAYYIDKKEKSEREKELEKHGFYDLYMEYESELKKSNALDFGDLIVHTVKLLSKNSDLKKKYQNRFKYLMIDEYQDTNKAQYQMIRELYEYNKNDLFVIGDEDQSIYSFRGANIYNILDFHKDFDNTKVIKLEENYRSHNNILKTANDIIQYNEHRLGKELYSSKEDGNPVNLIKFYNDKTEAEFVIEKIDNLIMDGVSPDEISIIYRNNSQSRLFEEKLRTKNIPYKIFGGMKFYDRKEIKDLISYLRFFINKNDDFSLKRIINLPTRGVGKKTIDNIEESSNKNHESMYETLINKRVKLSKKAESSINNFLEIFSSIKKGEKLQVIVSEILDKTGYIEMLEKSGTYEDMSRLDNLKEFKSSLYEYDRKGKNIFDLLEDISLISNEEDNISEKDCVNLMTVHASKGLEFEYVFLVGLEEDLFPSSRSLEVEDPACGIEEERRLFYVAITRAKIDLTLSYTSQRFQYGQLIYNRPSVFLQEMNKENINLIDLSN